MSEDSIPLKKTMNFINELKINKFEENQYHHNSNYIGLATISQTLFGESTTFTLK